MKNLMKWKDKKYPYIYIYISCNEFFGYSFCHEHIKSANTVRILSITSQLYLFKINELRLIYLKSHDEQILSFL